MNAIDLAGTQHEMDLIRRAAKDLEEVEVSEVSALDTSRALNAGLTPEMIKGVSDVLEFVIVVFNTGTAGLSFLRALRTELRERGGGVAVSDSTSGKPLGRIDGATTDETLTRLIPR